MPQSLFTARWRTDRTVVDLITGLNVSVKSLPCCWWKPRATNLALYLSMEPSGKYFIVKIHLHPTMFWWRRGGTSSWVPLRIWALISSIIAALHFGSFNASATVLGIEGFVLVSVGLVLIEVRENFWVGFVMLFLPLVLMGWLFGGSCWGCTCDVEAAGCIGETGWGGDGTGSWFWSGWCGWVGAKTIGVVVVAGGTRIGVVVGAGVNVAAGDWWGPGNGGRVCSSWRVGTRVAWLK